MKNFLIFLFLLLANFDVYAEIDCKNPSQQWMVETCQAMLKEDNLNSLVGTLSKTLRQKNLKDAEATLQNSQKGWEAHRSGTCDLLREVVGYTQLKNQPLEKRNLADMISAGEAQNNAGLECRNNLTDSRIKLLEDLLNAIR